MIERHYSLREAARLVGVDRHTLKAWLTADLAMEFPAVVRGSKFLVRETDLATVLRRRAPHSNFARRRRLNEALADLQTAAM